MKTKVWTVSAASLMVFLALYLGSYQLRNNERTTCITVLHAPCLVQFSHHKELSSTNYLNSATILPCLKGLFEKSSEVSNPFGGLQILSVCLNLEDVQQALILSSIFKVCSGLQKLSIMGDDQILTQSSSSNCLPDLETEFWEIQEIHKVVSHGVKVLEVGRFKGSNLELGFLRFILRNACMVEKVFISYHNGCSSEVRSSSASVLQAVPKAAPDAFIVHK